MNKDELKIAVDEYFVEHLDSGYWNALSPEVKAAAIKMATSDIGTEIDFEIDELTEDNYLVMAIAEQAVYLVRNHLEMTENKVVTSEGVEGISTGYTLINDNIAISHIAQRFIKRARRRNFAGSLRVGRG